jgi:uncharacterized protein (TIGR00369 family)
MKPLNPEYLQRIREMVDACPYFKLLSMRLVAAGRGSSLLTIDLEAKHLQPFGVVHGGVFASILDAAAFWAVYGDLADPEVGLTTVDLTLNYLAPAVDGQLVAKGKTLKLGRRLGYAEAFVYDKDEELVAHGTSTVMVLPGKAMASNPPLPAKFID